MDCEEKPAMKRFTETTKWSDPWFQNLTPESKLLWLYICDNCDCAGVWPVNLKLASFSIGYEYPNDTLSVAFGERLKKLDDEKIWVRKFCRFQYGTLNPECRPHAAVIQRLKVLNLFDELDTLSIGLTNPTGKGKGTRQGKGQEKGVVGGNGKSAESKAMTDEEWLKSLVASPAYTELDVMHQYQKMVEWCSVNRKQPNRRRFINWLNRCDRPMQPRKQESFI